MEIDLNTALVIGGMVTSGAAAWGGAAISIKGVKDSQTEVKKDLTAHTAADALIQLDLVSRLARIEGKLDEMRSDKR